MGSNGDTYDVSQGQGDVDVDRCVSKEDVVSMPSWDEILPKEIRRFRLSKHPTTYGL